MVLCMGKFSIVFPYIRYRYRYRLRARFFYGSSMERMQFERSSAAPAQSLIVKVKYVAAPGAPGLN